MNRHFTLLIAILLLKSVALSAQERRPQTELKVPGHDLHTNRVNLLHRLAPRLDGEGLTISIKEGRYDTTDIDLQLRHLPSPLAADFTATHASLMATLAAGAGNSYYTGRGVARAARLTTADFLNLWPDGRDYYESGNVSVQNHSYGVGIENFYGADAAAYDASVRELPYLLHVFSAGNQGDRTSEEGPYAGIAGYANLTGSFKMAKNVLTVAAADNTLSIPAQASKGPAYDGRLKPDITAAGQDGSSGAAALASGVSVLLQQTYLDETGQLPPAALVRALLFTGAEDIGPTGIDYQSGFGNLNAWRAWQILDRKRYYLGSLEENAKDSLTISLPPNVNELKITLTWTDPPADSLAAKALINDLDLELFHPATGQTWRPWLLSAFPHPDSLAQPAHRGRDTLNNQEQISLTLPAAGAYRIRIKAGDLPHTPQGFALAYDWDTLGHFSWTHPAPGDHLEAAETISLRWNTTLPSSPAILEYTLDEGLHWQLIADTVDLENEFWRWEAPDTFARARLRLRTPTGAFPTPDFYIYQGMKLQVGFNCEESALLYWDRLKITDEYVVYALEERYMQPIAVLQDTFLQIEKATNPAAYYAVGPKLSDTPENLRGPTIDYNQQGIRCYFKNFFAGVTGGGAVQLRINLGTLFGIRALTFQKLVGEEYQPLGTVTPNGGLTYDFLDPNLNEGNSYYRVRLDLLDGSTIYSNIQNVFYVPPETYRVFPNPVHDGERLNIIAGTTDESERIFYLFDGMGRQVGVIPIEVSYEFLELNFLPEGLYFYQIRKDGAQQQTGRIVVVRE